MTETLTILILIIILSIMYLMLIPDNLYKYRKELGIEKANLVHAADYSRIRDIVLSTRKTGFMKSEPIIWVAQRQEGSMYLGTNSRKDLRLWMEISSALKSVHIVLDGQSNHGRKTNLVRSKLPPVRVSLEGDFDSHFKLYCKPNQEILALQIIAPDVMYYIIKNLSATDIEIVDNQIAIFVRGGAESLDSINASIELLNQISKLTRAVQKVTRH